MLQYTLHRSIYFQQIVHQKRQPALVVSNIFESSNLSPKLPKVDLAKSIDTDASISESPSISFAIESSSECNSPTMEADSPDVSDSTSKEDQVTHQMQWKF